MKKVLKTMLTHVAVCALGFSAGAATAGKYLGESLKQCKKSMNKAERREQLYDNWMMAKKYGTPMDEYLLRKNVRRVAIYGTQQLGVRLYQELRDTEIEVVCSFDWNPKHMIYGIPNYKNPDAADMKLDAVIVSNFLMFDEIENELKKASYKNIIALDELIIELLEDKQNIECCLEKGEKKDEEYLGHS